MSEQNTVILGMLEAGKGKSDIITALVRDHGLDLGAAAKAYSETAKEGGYIKTKEDREKITIDVFHRYNTGEGFNREDAVAELMRTANVSKMTATSKLRDQAEVEGVDWPKATRTARDHDVIAEAVKAWNAEGYTEDQIKAGLREHYKFTEKNVGNAYRKYGKMAGFISGSGGPISWIQFIVDNENTPRKEWIEKMQAEFDYSEATAQTRYGIAQVAIQYHAAKIAAE